MCRPLGSSGLGAFSNYHPPIWCGTKAGQITQGFSLTLAQLHVHCTAGHTVASKVAGTYMV